MAQQVAVRPSGKLRLTGCRRRNFRDVLQHLRADRRAKGPSEYGTARFRARASSLLLISIPNTRPASGSASVPIRGGNR